MKEKIIQDPDNDIVKNVLIVSYSFPPRGGPASTRALKFVKYLPRFGWTPVVLTADKGPLRQLYQDPSLMEQVPTQIKVYRAKTLVPKSSVPTKNKTSSKNCKDKKNTVLSILLRKLYVTVISPFVIPDPYLPWSFFATLMGRKIVDRHDIPIVLTTLSPYSTTLTGYLLKKMKGVKWIIDYRDGWTTSPWYEHKGLRLRIERWLEGRMLRNADFIICVTEPLYEGIKESFTWIGDGKFEIIENGCDPEEYGGVEPIPHDTFTIVHTGSLSLKERNPLFFFKALKELCAEHQLYDKIKVYLIGNRFNEYGVPDESLEKEVAELGLSNVIEFIDPIPHEDALSYQLSADVLMLLYTSTKNVKEVMSSKIFEYIFAQKPILGLISESAASELIENEGIGFVVDPHDVEAIKAAILELYRKYHSDEPFIFSKNLFEKYNRISQTKRLAQRLEDIVKRE